MIRYKDEQIDDFELKRLKVKVTTSPNMVGNDRDKVSLNFSSVLFSTFNHVDI